MMDNANTLRSSGRTKSPTKSLNHSIVQMEATGSMKNSQQDNKSASSEEQFPPATVMATAAAGAFASQIDEKFFMKASTVSIDDSSKHAKVSQDHVENNVSNLADAAALPSLS